MPSSETFLSASLIAQAAYALLDGKDATRLVALSDRGTSAIPPVAARRFLGDGEFAGQGLIFVHYTPNSPTGFSASLFRDKATNRPILAIRGTDELVVDQAQDLKLSIVGFANDQLISLYRYYRELTTPGGQAVQYSQDEINLLHRLNTAGLNLLSGLV